MKIVIDPQVFQLGYSGMRRYYSALHSGLQDAGLKIIYPEKTHFNHDPGNKSRWHQHVSIRTKRIFDKLSFYRTRKAYYRALEEYDYDMVYITSPVFETGFLKHIQKKPFVMTVHDTMQAIPGIHTYYDQPRDTLSLGFLAHQASRVATVSDFTKNDLCKKYLVDPKKVQRVYLANFLGTNGEPIESLPERYILTVGTRNGRKNFFEWIKAVAPYLQKRPELKVIVTGALTTSEKYYYEKLEVSENILSLEEITDQQLVTLYKHALCLVYPTLYEGFGLPVLEAMSNGCPVITSHCTSIPEVAGDAALYIDPLNSKSMLENFVKLVDDPELQKELREKGLRQSEKFSTQTFINGMIDLFDNAIESSKM